MVLHNGQPSKTISLKAQNASAIVFSEMRDRHTTAKVFFLMLALVVYSSDVLPQQRNAVASERPAGLRFGQHPTAFAAVPFAGRLVEGSFRPDIDVVLRLAGSGWNHAGHVLHHLVFAQG